MSGTTEARAMTDAPERIWMAKNGGLPTGNYPQSDKVQYPRADLSPSPDVVKELVEAAKAMLDRHVLYCGGPGLPHAGHTDEKLFNRLSAALAKLEGGE